MEPNWNTKQKNKKKKSVGNKIHKQDCLEFLRATPDETFDLIVTSPPYNYGGFSRNGRVKSYDTYSDDMPIEDYQDWIGDILKECARTLKQGGAMYWNHKGKFEDFRFKHCFWIIDKCPLYFAQHIVWKYPASPDVAKIKWYPRKEDVFYFTKGKPKYFNEDMARITDIWEINHQEGNEHPAPFPISFAERCILASSEKGDLVYDPFMGSGTTAVACVKNDRQYIGTEISEKYITMANKKIEGYASQIRMF